MESEKKFGFKGLSLGKNTAPKKLQPGVLNEEIVEKIETEYVTGVEGKEIESESKKSKPEELIIPLQPNSIFKGLKRDRSETKPVQAKKPKFEKADLSDKNDLESNAVKELLEDAERENEDWENRDLEAPKDLTIPGMVNTNAESGSDSEADQEETDYEKVPISSFGAAMLRGMGWKEDEGIGRGDRKRVVDPIQAVARPRGMGLGADRSAHQTKNQVHSGKSRSKDTGEELELKKGAFCQITEGKNLDMYGEIVSLDDESARVHIKLTLGDSMSISQFKIRLVTKTEYGKYSKYINKGTADRYKEEERLKEEEKERKRTEERPRDKEGRSERKDDEKRSRNKERDSDGKKANRKDEQKPWLRPQLRVRIIDKSFSKGKYYKEKVRILDVLDKWTCDCRTDGGKLLTLKQDQLETVIPRDSPYVCLIRGRYTGSLGEILEKDKSRSTAAVQLLTDRDRVLEMPYDDICEYTGDIEGDLDY